MKRFTAHEEAVICKLYQQGYSSTEIAKMFNTYPSSILYVLERRGVKRRSQSQAQRKHCVDESFFEEIDTPEKAYWLGFIYADGSVIGKMLAIAISEKDAQHLEKFRRAIKTTYPIRYVDNTKPTPSGRAKCRKLAYIHIYSEKICNDLRRIGVKDKFPNCDFEKWHNLSDFVRGFFDGDGCLWFDKRRRGVGQVRVEFCGDKHFLEELKKRINKSIDIDYEVGGLRKCTNSNVWRLGYHGENAFKILIWMYRSSTPDTRLERKYVKFMEWLERLRRVEVLREERDKHVRKLEEVLRRGW